LIDISITLVFLELLRAAVGGGLAQVEALRAEAATASTELEAEQAPEPEALDQAEESLAPAPLARRFVWFQDPIGVDPNAPPPGPGSILSTDDALLQSLLSDLQAAGVGVTPGVIHEPDPGYTLQSGGGTTPSSARYKLREYTLYPQTSYIEPFTLLIPSPLPAAKRPLVVIFHKFGSSNLDVLQNTDFVQQCARRGWFLVCPLGASKKHFGSIESQTNTQAVLDWMLATPSLRIDVQRIYGIGFSMGGGAALNYAARHRDPAHAMFAAMIDHSGGVALNNTYANDAPARFILDFWFGDGSAGSAQPWRMTRSSVIDFDSFTLAADTSTDLARNLGSTPLQILRASSDPITYVANS
jgi:pimeloyl-ACP methyl ester carboxylesterase